jgi:hypothetical protein
MTIRSRTLATVLIAFALAAPLAGCNSNSGSAGGTGSLGDAPGNPGNNNAPDDPKPPATTTPPVAPPAEDTSEDETPDPGVTVTLNPVITVPPPLLLPWPSPADCVTHNPATVAKQYAAGLWLVVDGSHSLMAFKQSSDADQGLALAKAFKKHCFIGRGNGKPEPYRYIMDYWLEPVNGAAPVPNPDCVSHNPNNLTVHDLGDTGWRVQDGSHYIIILATKADAEDAVKVMKHYNRTCFVGRSYSGADRLEYIVNWWANA